MQASTVDTVLAVLLLLWAVGMWVGVAALHYVNWVNRPGLRRQVYLATMVMIVVGAIGQVGHVQEHFAQAGYWVLHPNEPGWMTPWGNSLARGFGQVDPTKPSLGMEILHLIGNFIFLAGFAAAMVITRRALRTTTRKWARMGMWMQGIHGLEHLALTLTVWFGAKQAIGLSTWFGLLDPGPGLWTYRVWWHFIANVIGTFIFGLTLYHLWRERRVIATTFAEDQPTQQQRHDDPEPALSTT